MREVIILNVLAAISFLKLVRPELDVTQVQVVFRHGDRTLNVHEVYPNDIHNVSAYEPWGLGQLTNTGKIREYQLGQLLKRRYQELLGPLYIPSALYAVSSDTDRTKMSLQLVLAGLFPPSEAETWNPELPWMPIPIHYVAIPLDITIHSYLCPQYADAVAEVMQLPEIRAKVSVHDDFFKVLTVKTGVNITELEQVYDVHNILVVQKAMNLTWPEWCTGAVFRQIRELTFLQFDIWSYTTRTRRLRGGPMVKRFIDNMHLNTTEENSRKMYLYSAHETTISGFLQALGILEPKIPQFGAAVMFEKLRNNDGKLFVRIVLWTGVTEELITLRLPGCEEVCPLEKYLQLTTEVIPSDEELDCHWKRLSNQKLRGVFKKDTTIGIQEDYSRLDSKNISYFEPNYT